MATTRRRRQRTEQIKKICQDRVTLERRNGSPFIYARTFIQGKPKGKSTREKAIAAATVVAENWFLELRDRERKGERIHARLFSEVAEAFFIHADRIRDVTEAQRKNYRDKWNLLKPHFENVTVSDVDAAFLMTLRESRSKDLTRNGTTVKPATLKKDFDFVRLVLRYAKEWLKCLRELPEFPAFRGQEWKIVPNPRPFFTKAQWRELRNRAKDRMLEPDLNPRTLRQRQELYCFMMMCVGAALRVGEANNLTWGDCELIRLNDKVGLPRFGGQFD